jgi:hypothetical protein
MHDACQKIIENLQQIAYLEAGAAVTNELMDCVLTTTDDIRILDYLVRQYSELRQALINFTTQESPYRLAK